MISATFHPKRKHFYNALESTAGTPVAPATLFVVGDEVVPVESIKLTVGTEFVERLPDGDSLQYLLSIPGRSPCKLGFSSRLIAPTTKGTAGPLSNLLKASNLAEVLVGSTSATYTETADQLNRLSVGFGILAEDGSDELEVELAGAAVNSLKMKADGIGKPVMIDWELMAKLAYVSSAYVIQDNGTPNNGVTYANDNANGFRLISATLTSGLAARQISKFEFDLGRSVELGTNWNGTDATGFDYAHLGKSKPMITIDPTVVPVATANDLLNMINGGSAAFAFTLAAPSGALFNFSAPLLQPQSISDDKVGDAIASWGIKALCARSQAGTTDSNNAFSFQFA